MSSGLFFAVFLLAAYVDAHGDDKPHWAYNSDHNQLDPNHWSTVSQYCDDRSYRQSPIDIDTTQLVSTENQKVCAPKNHLDWSVLGFRTHLKAKNNGHSLVLTPVSENGVKLNEAKNTRAQLVNWWNVETNILENQFYCLDSFHFHWGMRDDDGSEHSIDGTRYPLEIHWVHYSCDFNNLGQALAGWQGLLNQKKDMFVLGVVAIFFVIDDNQPNPALDAILKHKDQLIDAKNGNEVTIKNVNLFNLVPQDGLKNYYTYLGSLTTPPCTPVVKWHIMESKLTISTEQLAKFRDLKNSVGTNEAPNFRPRQYNNPRPMVYECVDSRS